MNKRTKLPIIQQLRVEKPCHESWDAMRGDETRRHCKACGHSVINLSELSEQAARSVLAEAQSKRICVRYARNADGKIQFKPDTSWSARLWRRAALALTFLPIAFGVIASARAEDQAITTSPATDKNTNCGDQKQQPLPPTVMGEVEPVKSPTPHAAQSQPTPEPTPEITMDLLAEGHDQSKSEIPDESKF